MLHHVVFINRGTRGGPRKTSSCPGRTGEPFYGTGEEHQRLLLPPGYGYRVDERDRWRMITMLMSHRLEPTRVWLEYTRDDGDVQAADARAAAVAARQRLRPDVELHRRRAAAPPGSTDERSADWAMPISGRIVAAGAHLHGSAKGLTVSQPRCGDRTLIDHRPRWGDARRPRLPRAARAARAGPDRDRLLPVAGAASRCAAASCCGSPAATTRELAAPGGDGDHARLRRARTSRAPRGCDPLPRRPPHRTGRAGSAATSWPPAQIPLTGLDARGQPAADRSAPPARASSPATAATVDLDALAVQRRRTSRSRSAATVTWRSLRPPSATSCMLANGPRAVDSPLMRPRRDPTSQRFDVPGTYNLFCYLHPVTMHQTLVVRPHVARP